MDHDYVAEGRDEIVRAERTRAWRDPPNMKNVRRPDSWRFTGHHKTDKRSACLLVAAVTCRAMGCGKLHLREDGTGRGGQVLNPTRMTACGMCWVEDVDEDPDDVRHRLCRTCASRLEDAT